MESGKALGLLSHLDTLIIENVQNVAEEALTRIVEPASFRALSLGFVGLRTDIIRERISRFPSLNHLRLVMIRTLENSGVSVADGIFAAVGEAEAVEQIPSSLITLHLSYSGMTQRGFQQLTPNRFPHLQSLTIGSGFDPQVFIQFPAFRILHMGNQIFHV